MQSLPVPRTRWEGLFQGSSSLVTFCRAHSALWKMLSHSSKLWESRPLPPLPPSPLALNLRQGATGRASGFRMLQADVRHQSLSGSSRLQGLFSFLKQVPYRPLIWLQEGRKNREPSPLPAGKWGTQLPPPDNWKPSPPLFSLIIPLQFQSLQVTIGLSHKLSLGSPPEKSHVHGATPFIERGAMVSFQPPPWAISRGFPDSAFRVFLVLQSLIPLPCLLWFHSFFEAFPAWGPCLLLEGMARFPMGSQFQPEDFETWELPHQAVAGR